jgi:hypothetical protein
VTEALARIGHATRITRTEILVAGLIAAILAAAAAIALPLLSGGGGPSVLPAGKDVAVAVTEFEPAHHTFGDRVQATLEIAVDRRRVDVSTVRPLVNLEPYRMLRSERSVHGDGRTALVRYRLTVDCLGRECVPGILGRRDITFPQTLVFYAGKGGEVRHVDATWPSLRVLTRVTPPDLGSFPLAVQAETLAGGGSYRRDPVMLAWLAAGGAALLLLAAAALLAWPLRRRRPEPVEEEPAAPPEPDSLARAVAAVEGTLAPPPEDERPQALDRLARELDASGHHELAREARVLAWRGGEISDAQLEALLASCRKEAGER